jgi:hypothetical protein
VGLVRLPTGWAAIVVELELEGGSPEELQIADVRLVRVNEPERRSDAWARFKIEAANNVYAFEPER